MTSQPPIEVLEYLAEDGRSPFREWLEALAARSALRIPYAPGYRVYFGKQGNTVVILLCGGDKRTQPRDIENAQVRWEDYLRRAT